MKRIICRGFYWLGFAAFSSLTFLLANVSRPEGEFEYSSPIALTISVVKDELYVLSQTDSSLAIIELETRLVTSEVPLGRFPTDSVLSPDGAFLYVSCLYDNCIQIVDLSSRAVSGSIEVGFEPYGLEISSDGKRLYVANSLSNTVRALSIDTGKVLFDTEVGRNPRYLAELADQGVLVVSNGLSRNATYLDARDGRVLETRSLERASLLRDVVFAKGGKYAIVAGLIAHDEMMTLQIERGWINSNGLYVMEVGERGRFVTVSLDGLLDGAANPWGLAISKDGERLYVSLAGIHELAIVDMSKLVALVEATAADDVVRLSQDVEAFDRHGLGVRCETGGLGPRGLALDERRGLVYVANYFSGDVSIMDSKTGSVEALLPIEKMPAEKSLWRQGELLFNDARLCQQNYYSCASCHQEDATMDGLNWDLVNDGKGNPKNAKSLHDAMDTPPVMWSGVRESMFAGVAAGQRFLGFIPNQENHEALTAYLSEPPRAPNPFVDEDEAAQARGQRVFDRARCDACHFGPTYSDGRRHDLGLRAHFEIRSRFYTPSLREVYRTGPYLHHGFAESLEDIFKEFNPDNRHGLTAGLTDAEIADLVAYLKTL
ncbi:c-type cytochrome [Pelagicoccus sp. SDUM812002]|uniref:c-type cytochrome n=1 Tax=Pelagicoccus sp. SDUM812002 TaxID=3041266 RepID=UPI00280F9A9A|nr:c-type cytochrome [Pelagicoccus sp. SDUM812002]MDQ8186636.1 c-type cytochrome [Pelagicoccus sp. SDUM812002]